jgi:hypothetical protein
LRWISPRSLRPHCLAHGPFAEWLSRR